MDRFDEHLRWVLAAPIYSLAYVCAAGVFFWMARRRGMDPRVAVSIAAAGLLGGLLGANLVQLLATGLPGKSIEGGILGGWLAVIAAKRYFGVTRPTGDLFALAIPAGEAIGRVGCFVGGCCYGKAATIAWAVHDHAAWRHPAQLYVAAAAAACFAVLLVLERRTRLPGNALFFIGGMLFCVERFAADFFRDVSPAAGTLTLAQIACFAGFVFFAYKLATLLPVRRGAVAPV